MVVEPTLVAKEILVAEAHAQLLLEPAAATAAKAVVAEKMELQTM